MKSVHTNAEFVANVSGMSAIWNTIFELTQEKDRTFVMYAANHLHNRLFCCVIFGEFTLTRGHLNVPSAQNHSSLIQK